MKTIPLTKNKFTIIDNTDFKKINQHKWFYLNGYAVRDQYIKYLKDKKRSIQKRIYLHRFVLDRNDLKKGLEVDHINGNTLDNRKSNLRICTHQENNHNSKKYKNNTSGYKGVSYNKRIKKWQGTIVIGLKHIHLGYFTTSVACAKAYNDAAIKLHGQFAQLNVTA